LSGEASRERLGHVEERSEAHTSAVVLVLEGFEEGESVLLEEGLSIAVLGSSSG